MFTYIIIIILALLLLFVFYPLKEHLANTEKVDKLVTRFTGCKDCTIWNHRDARSKCDQLCKSKFTNKGASFTGNWTTPTESGAVCECSYQGINQKYSVSCKKSDSIGTSDCFIWNQQQADAQCPYMCNIYLPGKSSTWTGQWNNSSTHTSSCECEYTD